MVTDFTGKHNETLPETEQNKVLQLIKNKLNCMCVCLLYAYLFLGRRAIFFMFQERLAVGAEL